MRGCISQEYLIGNIWSEFMGELGPWRYIIICFKHRTVKAKCHMLQIMVSEVHDTALR